MADIYVYGLPRKAEEVAQLLFGLSGVPADERGRMVYRAVKAMAAYETETQAEIERLQAENERLNAGVRAIEAAAEKCESACKAMSSFQLQYEDQGQTSVRAEALRSAIAIFKQAAEAAKEGEK